MNGHRLHFFIVLQRLFCHLFHPRSFHRGVFDDATSMPRPLGNSEQAVSMLVDVARKLTSSLGALEVNSGRVTLPRPCLLVKAVVCVEDPSNGVFLGLEAVWRVWWFLTL